MLHWLWNARQVYLLCTCSLTLVYLMTHPKTPPNTSEWALLAFDAMHSEHTIMLKQQWMLFKLQLLKMQLRSKPMTGLHLPPL